jgi:hypothetical protein
MAARFMSSRPKNQTYLITLKIMVPWRDGYSLEDNENGIATDPKGFEWTKMTWKMWFGLPMRRLVTENWFQIVVRVGSQVAGAAGVIATWPGTRRRIIAQAVATWRRGVPRGCPWPSSGSRLAARISITLKPKEFNGAPGEIRTPDP